jgi:poly(3-hydroxyoctanoate) depolymerase
VSGVVEDDGVPPGGAASDDYRPRVRSIVLPAGRVKVAEVGSGPPLLLINGIGASLETWRPLARRLCVNRQLILFDVPGTGGSGPLRAPLRMPGMARLAVDLLDQLSDTRVDVLGYSWGGAVAQQLARDAPNRVRRLVLVATSPGRGGKTPVLPMLALMGVPLQLVSGTYFSHIAPVIFGGDLGRMGSAALRGGPAPWDHLPSRWGYAQQMYAISGWTSLPWLARITAPTLVVSGADDPLVPVENARLLASHIPGARLSLVGDGGHLWLLEHAKTAAALIDEFLSSDESPRRRA